MTEIEIAEVAKLREIAEQRYSEDGGVMAECWDAASYEAAIRKDGTAEAAWAFHLRVVDANKEACAYYEVREHYEGK